MGKIKVILDPLKRQEHIDKLLEQDGLSHIKEDPNAAYCSISLTSAPEELKKILKSRQDILIESVLSPLGIIGYDPSSSKKFSPDLNPNVNPQEVYLADTSRVLEARYFTGHNILPSSGFGNEAEKARIYNRIAVILIDKEIRVSRMQPFRAIYLQYYNFEEQHKDFIDVFKMLQEFEPGTGFNDDVPVLLGFEKHGNKYFDLEEKVYNEFPNLQYKYNGECETIYANEIVIAESEDQPGQFLVGIDNQMAIEIKSNAFFRINKRQ